MSTISQLKTNHDTVIRQKTAPKSISTDNHADLLDGLADEVLDRGVTQVLDTTELQALSGANYRNVVVKDNGIYKWKASGTPNGTTIFAATGGGIYEKQFGAIQNLIVDTTYANLVILIGNSELIPGLKYRITDFQTVHYMMNSGFILTDVNPSGDINVGTIEPLIVTAITSDTLDKLAISETYPQDIIYYDWNPENWKRDNSFSDVTITNNVNTATIVPGWKGVIYFRHDTQWNNYKKNDFRNVKYRRYKPTAPDWNNATAYVVGDWVFRIDAYFLCIQNHTNQTPPSQFGNSVYWFRSGNASFFNEPDRYFLMQNIQGLVKSSSFRDWKSFEVATGASDDYDDGVFTNNHFDSSEENYQYWNFRGTILDNIIIVNTGSLFRIEGNKFGPQCGNCFLSGCFDNEFSTMLNSISLDKIYQSKIIYCENTLVGEVGGSSIVIGYNSMVNKIFNVFGQISGRVFGLVSYHGLFGSYMPYGKYVENLVGNYFDTSNNLISATYIFITSRSKQMIKNTSGQWRLIYYDGSDVQQIVDPLT